MKTFEQYILENKKYYYHATYKPLLSSIKKYGLDPSKGSSNWVDSKKVIYLSDDPNVAESYAETSEEVDEDWLDEIVILKIDSKSLKKDKLTNDTNVRTDDSHTFEYHKKIPWKNIKIYENI